MTTQQNLLHKPRGTKFAAFLNKDLSPNAGGPGSGSVTYVLQSSKHLCCYFSSQNSGCAVRSIDFNPNKQYYLCAGADDGSLAVWDSRQPSQPLRFVSKPVLWIRIGFNADPDPAFQVNVDSDPDSIWDSRQPAQPLRFVSTSVVDPHWFQRVSGSSTLGQGGFGSGFNMGLQAARPTSQVCFNQCCGSALVL